MALRLVVADDHRLFRQALCGLIHGFAGMEVVGEAHNGEDAIRKARDLRPDIVLMDLEMPDINGVVATRDQGRSAVGLRGRRTDFRSDAGGSMGVCAQARGL